MQQKCCDWYCDSSVVDIVGAIHDSKMRHHTPDNAIRKPSATFSASGVCDLCSDSNSCAHDLRLEHAKVGQQSMGKGLEGIPSLSTGVWQGSRQAIPCAQAEEGLVPLQKLATLSQQHFALELFITTPCPKLDVANY